MVLAQAFVALALATLALGCCARPASRAEAMARAGAGDVARVQPPAPAAGVVAAAARARACPPEMALVGTTCVDRWEAHLVLPTGERASPYDRPREGVRHQARSAPGVVPQGYVSRVEASAACRDAGKRLCFAREWLAACEGASRTRYPYGNAAREGACNTGKPHLMQKLFGPDTRIYTFEAHYNSPKLNRFPGFLSATGEHTGCVSEAGIHDMVGNLHEWVADPVDARFRKLLVERHADQHVRDSATDGNGAFLGGFYSTREQHGVGCSYITPAHEPAYHDYSTGFRCCRDAAEQE